MAFGYRSSTGALDRFDDHEPPSRRPERWDREKFERMSSRRPPYDDRETFRYLEREREDYPPPPPRSRPDVSVEDRIDIRSSRSRLDERERFYDDDILDRRPGRRPEFLNREEPSPAEVASRALAPYRRKTVVERDLSPPARRPTRPGMLRRQSSLDTFDRRPLRRYEERDREEWRPPANVDIPLPIRRRSPSRRRRSPPRDRYREDDFEEIKYRDAEPEYREDYREVEIRREKSRARKSRRSDRSERSESRFRAPSSKSSSSSSSSFEEIREVSPPPLPGKKGKTRMPKRLVHKSAIIQLGYPFEEEDDFIIVKRALEKPQIDEVIKISETYKNEDGKRTTYKREIIEERIEESNHIGGPLTVVVPERGRSDREIKEEIRRLENERKALQLERRAEDLRLAPIEYRETEYEIIEERPRERNVVRVDKDRKGRLALVRSSH
ncbi:hypothetical protein SLS57_009613 [Botryosphaeria dothidea]